MRAEVVSGGGRDHVGFNCVEGAMGSTWTGGRQILAGI